MINPSLNPVRQTLQASQISPSMMGKNPLKIKGGPKETTSTPTPKATKSMGQKGRENSALQLKGLTDAPNQMKLLGQNAFDLGVDFLMKNISDFPSMPDLGGIKNMFSGVGSSSKSLLGGGLKGPQGVNPLAQLNQLTAMPNPLEDMGDIGEQLKMGGIKKGGIPLPEGNPVMQMMDLFEKAKAF